MKTIVIDKQFKDEPNVEASIWIDLIQQLTDNNKELIERVEANAAQKRELERKLYSKYKIRFRKR